MRIMYQDLPRKLYVSRKRTGFGSTMGLQHMHSVHRGVPRELALSWDGVPPVACDKERLPSPSSPR